MKETQMAPNNYVFIFYLKKKKQDTRLKPVSHAGKQSVVAMPMGRRYINSMGVCSEYS